MNEPLRNETKQIKKTCNLMATAHSREKEHYQLYDHAFTWGGLGAGIVLLAFVFSPPDTVLSITGITPLWFSRLAGFASMLTLFSSTFQLGWKPAAHAAAHAEAAAHYVAVKHTATRLLAQEDISESEFAALQARHLDTGNLPGIPERRFLKSKQWHETKVAISRALTDQPHKPLRKIKRELRTYGKVLPLPQPPERG